MKIDWTKEEREYLLTLCENYYNAKSKARYSEDYETEATRLANYATGKVLDKPNDDPALITYAD